MSLVMSDPTPPSGKDELREKLIDMYMKIACGFYFEGSDETTEKLEYAPKFADEIMQLIAQQNQQAVQKAEASITKLQTDLGAAMGHMEGCGHPYKYLIEHYPDLAELTAAQPRKDGDEQTI